MPKVQLTKSQIKLIIIELKEHMVGMNYPPIENKINRVIERLKEPLRKVKTNERKTN